MCLESTKAQEDGVRQPLLYQLTGATEHQCLPAVTHCSKLEKKLMCSVNNYTHFSALDPQRLHSHMYIHNISHCIHLVNAPTTQATTIKCMFHLPQTGSRTSLSVTGFQECQQQQCSWWSGNEAACAHENKCYAYIQ